MDSSTSVWLLSRHESFEYFLRFFQRVCGVCAFLSSSVSHGVASPPFLPTLTVYYREVPLLDFRLVWYWSGVFCSVWADCVDDSSADSCVCLAQGCRGGGFFPNSAVFALVLGTSVLAYGILALPLLFLGYAYGVAFFDSVCLSSASLYPAVAGLVDFSCGPPSLVVPVCVWGSFWGGEAVSFSPPARRGVGYCWASSGVASVPLPGAPAVFRSMSCRWLPLAGSATFLAPVDWPAPAVVTCWVGGVFGAPLGFYLVPCSSSGACGLRRLPLGGFSAFSVTGCLTYCRSGGVGWATSLPLYFLCFSCAGWLAGVCWVLHPVSGSSLWGCVCSSGDSVIALLAFPYLRVGALLACGVCCVS